jgi:hypothetical protein
MKRAREMYETLMGRAPTLPKAGNAERLARIREIFGWRPIKEWDEAFLLKLLDEARETASPVAETPDKDH